MTTGALASWTPFSHAEVIKCDPGRDFYVAWSHIVEAPTWAGTRAEAIAAGCEPDRLGRADTFGSSFHLFDPLAPDVLQPGCWWHDEGLIAEQLGHLPRAKLAAYVTAYARNRLGEAYAMLERFDDDTREEHLARVRLAIRHHHRRERPRGHGHCRVCRPEQDSRPLPVDGREYQRRLRNRRRR